MRIWSQAPLVRLLLPFIAGVLLSDCCDIPAELPLTILFILLPILALMLLHKGFRLSYRLSWIFAIPALICLILAGYVLARQHSPKPGPVVAHTLLAVRVDGNPQQREHSVRFSAMVLAYKDSLQWLPLNEDVMFSCANDSNSVRLQYGDQLICKGTLTEVAPPANPGAFDYKSFLRHKGILRQLHVYGSDWKQLRRNDAGWLRRCAVKLRQHLLAALSDNGVTGNEFAVGAALLLGYTDKLDADLLSDYAGTGALHVLSVSGLHVAIVFIIFSRLLFFLDRFKHGGIIRAAVLVALLWFYALLTGLSPSVMRSATMLSFVIVGKTFRRSTNIYNTLAASVLLLLLFEPFLLYDVGFQLSYIAVAGIVYMQPAIQSLWDPQNWFSEQVWSVTAVSIAAQLATFPLSLFYFHQFPNYFLISNLAVIPVSTIVMYAGIALFLLAKVPVVCGMLGAVFNFLVWLLNKTVAVIAALPCALTTGIRISVPQLLLLYLSIACLCSYFERRKILRLNCCIACLVAIFILAILDQLMRENSRQVVIYSTSRSVLIDCMEGNTCLSVVTDSLTDETKFAAASRLFYGIESTTSRKANRIKWGDINCVIADRASLAAADQNASHLIISAACGAPDERLIPGKMPALIVLAADLKKRQLEAWKNFCRRKNIAYYSIREQGALILEPE